MNNNIWKMAVLILASWLAGCSQTVSEVPASLVTPIAGEQKPVEIDAPLPVSVAEIAPSRGADDAEARMRHCNGELQALRKVDKKRYAERKVEFDRLMSGAAMYAGVRGSVQSRTQDAVDALYRYRTDKLCADIGQDVLNGLALTGNAGRAL
ncbi:hypothetical protein [Serratia marcescens]|uniref:hypothetical protein n=1 Tax=Serratia marcescens TaxID=615 RepID=UPI000E582604|nr:hypothetical protein [Serratia marcescens]AXX20533.1 hypothetical protein C7M66_15595 [Serratia marcescens]AXX26639.1 hypothetical protein C7M65_22410 [Serratia marcescens]RTF01797.1 hypothetical protein C7M70_02650 [Serratia marcescens]RTF03033.1 hypothetical protein C7M68_00650 [Serratia marcescens]RTF05614.1 hypothetical protein C7M69_23710 [Serratia marcescens]